MSGKISALLVALPTMALLSIAQPISASTWLAGCIAGATMDQIAPQGLACAVPTSATDDTVILDTHLCGDIDVFVYPDANGNGTGATSLQSTLQSCPVSKADGVVNTDGERDAACNTIGTTITGAGNIHGSGMAGMGVRVNFAGTFAADPVVFVKCN